MIHLASLSPGTRTSLPELAAAIEVPDQFLSKVLQMLCRRRFIHSHRGVSGGFELAVDPETISVLEVIETIEGPIQLNICLGPGLGCNRKLRCPAHLVWAEAQEALQAVLRRASIAKLARTSAQVN